MDVRHLDQRQLAERWRVSEAPLVLWRSEGIGPQFLKIHRRVLYRLTDIKLYEDRCLRASTAKASVERMRVIR